VLLHHPDRATLLRTFKGYMKISKESTPQLARHMEALEGGMLALLGQGRSRRRADPVIPAGEFVIPAQAGIQGVGTARAARSLGSLGFPPSRE
jgi:hypothetical protein